MTAIRKTLVSSAAFAAALAVTSSASGKDVDKPAICKGDLAELSAAQDGLMNARVRVADAEKRAKDDGCLVKEANVTKDNGTGKGPKKKSAPPQASAQGASSAPPRDDTAADVPPPPPPAPRPVFAFNGVITLPMATPGTQGRDQVLALVADTECGYQGFWNWLINADNEICKRTGVTQSTTMIADMGLATDKDGNVMHDKDGNPIPIIIPGRVSMTAVVTTEGYTAPGWWYGALGLVNTGVNAYVGIKGIEIAEQGLQATLNLNGQIIKNLKSGSFNLFGNLDCGSATAVNSNTGDLKASCNVGDVFTNSVGGNDSTSSPTNPTTNQTVTLGGGPNP